MLECLNAWMLECLNAWMLECLNAWMLECLNAWMLECLNAWCLDDWMIGCLDAWMIGCLDDWMLGWLDAWMIGCHFYPFLKKRWHGILYLAVFNQWLMVRFILWCALSFYLMMHFILIYLKLISFKAYFIQSFIPPPFQSFPTAFIYLFHIPKTLSKL